MPKSRRQFLTETSLGLLGAALASSSTELVHLERRPHSAPDQPSDPRCRPPRLPKQKNSCRCN